MSKYSKLKRKRTRREEPQDPEKGLTKDGKIRRRKAGAGRNLIGKTPTQNVNYTIFEHQIEYIDNLAVKWFGTSDKKSSSALRAIIKFHEENYKGE